MSSLNFAQLAAEAADPAENLPDGAAAVAAAGVAVEEIHLADLLVRFRLARTRGLYRMWAENSSCKCFQYIGEIVIKFQFVELFDALPIMSFRGGPTGQRGNLPVQCL